MTFDPREDGEDLGQLISERDYLTGRIFEMSEMVYRIEQQIDEHNRRLCSILSQIQELG